jgi:hypothetical protein
MSYTISGTVEAPPTFPNHFHFDLGPEVKTIERAKIAAELLTDREKTRWPVKTYELSCDGHVVDKFPKDLPNEKGDSVPVFT